MESKKVWKIGRILAVCLLTGTLAVGMAGCGEDKESDSGIQELLTPTPGPTPTPEPSGGSVVTNGDITMVNEYVNQKAKGEITVPVTPTQAPSDEGSDGSQPGEDGEDYSDDSSDYSEEDYSDYSEEDYSEDDSGYSDDSYEDYSDDGSDYYSEDEY